MAFSLLVIRRWYWLVCALLLVATAYLRLVAGASRFLFLHGLAAYGVVAIGALVAPWLAWQALNRSFSAAFEHEDVAALRALARALEPCAAEPAFKRFARNVEIGVLGVEERHAEIRAICANAFRPQMPIAQRAMLGSALAWATAHAGDAEEAVQIAQAAVVDGKDLPPAHRALCRGTLGAALVLARRPADAVVELEAARAAGGTPRAQATRAFYLGEAYRALQRSDEARSAYTQAEREFPDSRWATRSRTARSALSAYR